MNSVKSTKVKATARLNRDYDYEVGLKRLQLKDN